MTEAKFIGFFRLVETCRLPGCPVCRCVADESRSYLDALLYEQVTDLDTRRAIRAAWGFCNWHTWMLPEIAGALFGAAIIYEDLVTLVLQQTERLGAERPGPGRRSWFGARIARRGRDAILRLYRRRAICPACTHAAETEKRYLETMVRFVDDGDLQAAYARSDGLCLPHLLEAVDGSGASPAARTLVERTRWHWARLGRDIASFVGKHDYRNREPYTEAEAASYARAFEVLAGARNVFGNDVDARASSPRGVGKG